MVSIRGKDWKIKEASHGASRNLALFLASALKMVVCIECGQQVPALYEQYSEGNISLCVCVRIITTIFCRFSRKVYLQSIGKLRKVRGQVH